MLKEAFIATTMFLIGMYTHYHIFAAPTIRKLKERLIINQSEELNSLMYYLGYVESCNTRRKLLDRATDILVALYGNEKES